MKDKEETQEGRDSISQEEPQDNPKSDDGQEDSEVPNINESGEAAQKFPNVLLFYLCIIHDNNYINPVLIVPHFSSDAEQSSKKFCKAIQDQSRNGPD